MFCCFPFLPCRYSCLQPSSIDNTLAMDNYLIQTHFKKIQTIPLRSFLFLVEAWLSNLLYERNPEACTSRPAGTVVELWPLSMETFLAKLFQLLCGFWMRGLQAYQDESQAKQAACSQSVLPFLMNCRITERRPGAHQLGGGCSRLPALGGSPCSSCC